MSSLTPFVPLQVEGVTIKSKSPVLTYPQPDWLSIYVTRSDKKGLIACQNLTIISKFEIL